MKFKIYIFSIFVIFLIITYVNLFNKNNDEDVKQFYMRFL